jgi:hypothetical protein
MSSDENSQSFLEFKSVSENDLDYFKENYPFPFEREYVNWESLPHIWGNDHHHQERSIQSFPEFKSVSENYPNYFIENPFKSKYDNTESLSHIWENDHNHQEGRLIPSKAKSSLIFKVEKDMGRGFSESTNTSDSNESREIGKKRGRQNNKDEIQHSKFKNDNKMAKIQRNYMTFLIRFLNLIIYLLLNDKDYLFCDIDGDYKSNVNQKNRVSLNKKTIKEIILEAPISGKIYKKDNNHNKTICNRLEEKGQKIILNILDQKFLFFFENIYYANLKRYDLTPFGLEFEVDLTKDEKIKTFKDLLNKEKLLNIDYKNGMKKCVENHFLLNIHKKKNNSLII